MPWREIISNNYANFQPDVEKVKWTVTELMVNMLNMVCVRTEGDMVSGSWQNKGAGSTAICIHPHTCTCIRPTHKALWRTTH